MYDLPLGISVVICAYTEDRWTELLSAVDSIEQQALKPIEIIIVIDHNPKLFERTKVQFPDLKVIENQEAQGLSGARNSAIACAKGEVIAFMDEDATASPDWLATLSNAYREPDVIGTGGEIKPMWVSSRPSWFPREFDWVVGCSYLGLPTEISKVRNLIGCNMSFRREVFSAVGGFRNGIGRIGTLPIGCEETELCIRVNQLWPQGIFLYDPTAVVFHRVPLQRSSFKYFRSRCYSEGISKATISKFTGSRDGLESEWRYTLSVLPRGVLRGLADVLFRRDFSGIGRASAIVSGLVFTMIGFLVGKIQSAKFVPNGIHEETHETLIKNLAQGS